MDLYHKIMYMIALGWVILLFLLLVIKPIDKSTQYFEEHK